MEMECIKWHIKIQKCPGIRHPDPVLDRLFGDELDCSKMTRWRLLATESTDSILSQLHSDNSVYSSLD